MLGAIAEIRNGVARMAGGKLDQPLAVEGQDAFGEIGGAIGIKIPEPGARRGVLNSSQNILVAFTATGGTPQLSEVNAGAGTVYLAYALAPV